jgi:hypothetical protein
MHEQTGEARSAVDKKRKRKMSTEAKAKPVFKLVTDLGKNPSLQKEILHDRPAVLERYGVTSAQFETIQEALSVPSRVRVQPDFPWPPSGNNDIVIDSMAPESLVAQTSIPVVIEGEGFPLHVGFAFSSPAQRGVDSPAPIYFGTVTQRTDTQINGIIYIAGEPDFEYTLYVINTDDQSAGELDDIVVTAP